MREFIFLEQRATVDQFLHDARVGFENRLALQISGFRSEPSFRIHRRHDRQAVAHADFVVFLAMSRRDVNAAGALILGHIIAEDNFRLAIKPRMLANHAF